MSDGRSEPVDWLARRAAGVPIFGRRDEGAHDRLVAAREQPVVLGDRAGPDRVLGFHRLGDVEQLARFADQAEPRQPAEQIVEQLAERAGADDPPRPAAFGERHVEQLLRGEPLGERGPMACDCRPRRRPARRAARRPTRHRSIRTCAASPDASPCAGSGQDQAAGVGRFDARGDDVLEQRILDHPLAVEFDHRVVRAGRLRNRIAMHRLEQLQQFVVARDGLLAPVVEQLLPVGLSQPTSMLQAIAACRHSRAIVVRNSSRWPSRWASSSSSNSAAVGVFVDDVGVEAIVGAVAIDHVFVGGAVQLVGLVVVPRLVVLGSASPVGIVVARRLPESSSSESSSSSSSAASRESSNSGTCQ